jgi:hypothetical protein
MVVVSWRELSRWKAPALATIFKKDAAFLPDNIFAVIINTIQLNMAISVSLRKAPSKRAAASSKSATPLTLDVEPSSTLEQLYTEAAARTRVRATSLADMSTT